MATLRSLTIQNFKGIKDPVKIEFKPITLLFGPNSAGKSTIIQALQYAREIFVNHNLDPHRIFVHGEQTDLGGFRALVHNHDLSRDIVLELEFDSDGLPSCAQHDDHFAEQIDESVGDYGSNSKPLSRLSVEVTVTSGDELPRPYVRQYVVRLNGEFFCQIDPIDKYPFWVKHFGETVANHLLEEINKPKSDRAVALKSLIPVPSKYRLRVNLKHSAYHHDHDTSEGKDRDSLTEFAELVLDQPSEWHWSGVAGESSGEGIPISTKMDALPDWDQPFDFLGQGKTFDKSPLDSYNAYRVLHGFSDLMSKLVLGPGKVVQKNLDRFRHLGPLRSVPPSVSFRVKRSPQGAPARAGGGLPVSSLA